MLGPFLGALSRWRRRRETLTKEGLFAMGNDRDLVKVEEEGFGVLATDAAAPTVEDQEGTANGALRNGSKAINTNMDLHCRMIWKWEIKRVS